MTNQIVISEPVFNEGLANCTRSEERNVKPNVIVDIPFPDHVFVTKVYKDVLIEEMRY